MHLKECNKIARLGFGIIVPVLQTPQIRCDQNGGPTIIIEVHAKISKVTDEKSLYVAVAEIMRKL